MIDDGDFPFCFPILNGTVDRDNLNLLRTQKSKRELKQNTIVKKIKFPL